MCVCVNVWNSYEWLHINYFTIICQKQCKIHTLKHNTLAYRCMYDGQSASPFIGIYIYIFFYTFVHISDFIFRFSNIFLSFAKHCVSICIFTKCHLTTDHDDDDDDDGQLLLFPQAIARDQPSTRYTCIHMHVYMYICMVCVYIDLA